LSFLKALGVSPFGDNLNLTFKSRWSHFGLHSRKKERKKEREKEKIFGNVDRIDPTCTLKYFIKKLSLRQPLQIWYCHKNNWNFSFSFKTSEMLLIDLCDDYTRVSCEFEFSLWFELGIQAWNINNNIVLTLL
jgi:hypothetical protein